jgi:hypothetical protein
MSDDYKKLAMIITGFCIAYIGAIGVAVWIIERCRYVY